MRKEGNLHGLWDSGLIDYAGMTYNEFATDCDIINKNETRNWQKDELTKWAFESYQITARLYAEAAQNPEFDYDYYPQHSEIIKKRLAQAGLRLAEVLNEIYK